MNISFDLRVFSAVRLRSGDAQASRNYPQQQAHSRDHSCTHEAIFIEHFVSPFTVGRRHPDGPEIAAFTRLERSDANYLDADARQMFLWCCPKMILLQLNGSAGESCRRR
jgi:hypothetical protein